MEIPTGFIMIVHSLCLHPGIIRVPRVIHISSVHLRPQTKASSVSQQETRYNQKDGFWFVFFFLSLQYISYIATIPPWQIIFISAILFQLIYSCSYRYSTRGCHKRQSSPQSAPGWTACGAASPIPLSPQGISARSSRPPPQILASG